MKGSEEMEERKEGGKLTAKKLNFEAVTAGSQPLLRPWTYCYLLRYLGVIK